MNRTTLRSITPSPELIEKMRRACTAIADQKPRELKCPYCKHRIAMIFPDTRGHLETKCEKCGRIIVFDLVNMRRSRTD